MANNKENNPQQQPAPHNTGDIVGNREVQFNEVSELSLEERMNVADKMGIPVQNQSDDAETNEPTENKDAATGSID